MRITILLYKKHCLRLSGCRCIRLDETSSMQRSGLMQKCKFCRSYLYFWVARFKADNELKWHDKWMANQVSTKLSLSAGRFCVWIILVAVAAFCDLDDFHFGNEPKLQIAAVLSKDRNL